MTRYINVYQSTRDKTQWVSLTAFKTRENADNAAQVLKGLSAYQRILLLVVKEKKS